MRTINNTKLCPILSAKIIAQSREELPIIVQLKGENLDLNSYTSSISSRVKSSLPLIGGFSGSMDTDMIYKLANSPQVEYISFDSKVYTLLDIATPTMEAYFPHDQGYEGEDITIAIIDTGIAPHDDLIRPNNRIIGFMDFVNNQRRPYDDNGHGTHVAGIIGGNGFASKGRFTGVAPKSNLLGIKALDNSGGGNISDIIAALDYVVETKDRYNTRIVNLSLGTQANNSCDKDPLCRAVDKVVKSGLIVVAAAGNSGPNAGTILSPGISPAVITVGAVDDKRTIDPRDDTIANFSSRGPTKDGLLKPDIVAPGVNIKSLSNVKLDSYTSLSGTSMATPLISGSIALMLNKDSNLTPSMVKEKILSSVIDLKDSRENQGAGMLNLKFLFAQGMEEKDSKALKEKSILGKELSQGILMILVILFLLDSNL